MLLCRVNFLDDTYFVWELERNALGQDLFKKVCDHLNLIERDYYGLVMWDSPSTRVWLDCAKEIRKQIKSPETEFFFNIKFYPPDPSILAEDITRYLLCLQLRKDILIGRLPCPSDILALLGSYTVQSTLGDYDPNLHQNNYVSEIVLAPNQSEELEERIMELHSTYRFMSPAQADMLFLENAMQLPMYGVDLHPAKDVSGADVMIGVCFEGLMVYEDEIKTNIFLWPRVLKTSHKRSTFFLKMRPSEEDEFEGVISFKLASYRACKQLWKCCVEHHSFFRNRLQDTKTKRLLTLGSRFRYQGRTQSECLEASGNITRAPPQFTRFIIKRKGNEEFLDVLKQPVRTELDDWFLVYGPDKWRISTSDDVMLESEELQEWKHQPDDWCVLLDGTPFILLSVQQPLQTEEIREDVEVVERSEDKLTDELVIKQSYKVQVVQEGSDIIEKKLPDFEFKQEIVKPLKETLKEEVLEVNGERTQRVVITKQWTQKVNSLVESQDVDKKIEMMEMVERRVIVTENMTLGSEDTFDRLEIMEQRLEEVDAIKHTLAEVEELRFGLQEVERLEQRLQQVEKEELQRAEPDDWYILLDRRPLMLTADITPRGGIQEELQQMYIPQPMKKYDDWYIVFDVLPKTMEISLSLPDVSRYTPEEDQGEEEKIVVERKIQQELVTPEETKTQTREELIQSRVKTEEVQEEQEEQVAVDYRRLQPVVLEQRAAEPQTDTEDDWFDVLDGSPKRSVPSVELYEETREEVIQGRVRAEQINQQEQVTVDYGRPQTVILEQKTTQPQRDVEDDWFIYFDISSKESEPLVYPLLPAPAVELYEETREEVIQSRVRTEEQVTEVKTVSAKEQTIILEKERTSIIQAPQLPVTPRDIDDDWFQLFDKEPHEQKSFPSEARVVSVPPLESEEKPAVERRRKEEEQINPQEQMTEVYRRPEPVILEQKAAEPQRDVEDDWFHLDVSPKESVPLSPLRRAPAVELYEETREEVIQSRVRTEEQVTEVMTVSTKEQTIVLEKERTSIIQAPQLPVTPRDIDDDWFQLFDKEPHEQKSLPSDVRGRDFEVREPIKDQRVQRVVEEQMREKTLITEEKRVIIDERRERADAVIPVEVREADDDWFEILDAAPPEMRSVPSVAVATEERRMKEQEDGRVRQQQMRVREEEEERLREQEKRKQELDLRRAQAAVTVKTEAQPQIEKDDDWFILFDVSLKEAVVADVLKVDRRAEEEKMRWEEERRKQIKIEERIKTPSVPEKKPVHLQTEVEDDWSTLMGISSKDYTPPPRPTPVISPVAPPKPRPQIQADQPLTSTPTARPVSITKTYQERTEDAWNITLESEQSATESVLMRKTRRSEGDSIYIRHSILMLEDFDVSHEMILKHYASISELKRVFMDVKQDFGPTEWDRRLSSYSPTAKAEFLHANDEILVRMGLIEEDGKTVLFRSQEIIYV
ncbi:protein 4.1b isoform X1 [Carassius auratus]|uniref:Protein 4.1 n=1 Tax=Carassius auratus TaxID=7957 RepID=A0A6P6R5A8_CARAU|nr:trichohyalin-like isoform X1 [Carassius auratus]